MTGYIAVALAQDRFITIFLVSFAGVALLLAVAAALASAIPARRATRVDPMGVLKAE